METEHGSSAAVAELAEALVGKVRQAFGELDVQMTTHRVKNKLEGKEITSEFLMPVHTGIVDRAGLKQLTGVLKDLQAIRGEITELERREREARIESLRRSVGIQEVDDGDTGVILLPVREGSGLG